MTLGEYNKIRDNKIIIFLLNTVFYIYGDLVYTYINNKVNYYFNKVTIIKKDFRSDIKNIIIFKINYFYTLIRINLE